MTNAFEEIKAAQAGVPFAPMSGTPVQMPAPQVASPGSEVGVDPHPATVNPTMPGTVPTPPVQHDAPWGTWGASR